MDMRHKSNKPSEKLLGGNRWFPVHGGFSDVDGIRRGNKVRRVGVCSDDVLYTRQGHADLVPVDGNVDAFEVDGAIYYLGVEDVCTGKRFCDSCESLVTSLGALAWVN